MSKIIRAVGKAVATGFTTVVGGIFSKLSNLIKLFKNNGAERHRALRGTGITQWELSAKYSGWVMAKCYEDLTKSVFYFFAYNKSNENTLTMAIVQGKAVGCKPEMYVYTKDRETGDIDGVKYPSPYDVKDLKEIFD